jgi:hypothetical protein
MSAIPKKAPILAFKLSKLLFYNNVELATTINKLIKECMSTLIYKDAFGRFNFTRTAGTDHTDANGKIYR